MLPQELPLLPRSGLNVCIWSFGYHDLPLQHNVRLQWAKLQTE